MEVPIIWSAKAIEGVKANTLEDATKVLSNPKIIKKIMSRLVKAYIKNFKSGGKSPILLNQEEKESELSEFGTPFDEPIW